MLTNATTFLFVPGDHPGRFLKAIRTSSDVVIVDLEDAVAPSRKKFARDELRDSWPELREEANAYSVALCIRINAMSDEESKEDIELCRQIKPEFLMLPKAEASCDFLRLRELLPECRLIALIETATGVLDATAIARTEPVVRLALGTVDLSLNLGIDPTAPSLDAIRVLLVLASSAAGLTRPVDGICTALGDEALLAEDCRLAREAGFGGKMCIHPKQVDVVKKAFAPTESEIAWARKVIAGANEASGGAVSVDGFMVDKPVLLKARQIVQRAGFVETDG
jgi:citrate lyase subunit beta/citryl-CoA lyase